MQVSRVHWACIPVEPHVSPVQGCSAVVSPICSDLLNLNVIPVLTLQDLNDNLAIWGYEESCIIVYTMSICLSLAGVTESTHSLTWVCTPFPGVPSYVHATYNIMVSTNIVFNSHKCMNLSIGATKKLAFYVLCMIHPGSLWSPCFVIWE
jgi:hypothetical protein